MEASRHVPVTYSGVILVQRQVALRSTRGRSTLSASPSGSSSSVLFPTPRRPWHLEFDHRRSDRQRPQLEGPYFTATRSFSGARRRNKAPSLYEVIGVPKTATQAEIKRAYLQEAKKCHPDVNPSKDATERFQALAEAYQVLGNADSRARYDAAGASASASDFEQQQRAQQQQQQHWQQPPPNQGPADPFRMFQAAMEEMGIEDVKNYFTNLNRDAAVASDAARAGNFQPARDFAWNYKGLFAGVILPTILVFRFPALVVASFRFLGAAAALVGSAFLRDPNLQRLVGQWVYQSWRLFHARVQAKAREKK